MPCDFRSDLRSDGDSFDLAGYQTLEWLEAASYTKTYSETMSDEPGSFDDLPDIIAACIAEQEPDSGCVSRVIFVKEVDTVSRRILSECGHWFDVVLDKGLEYYSIDFLVSDFPKTELVILTEVEPGKWKREPPWQDAFWG